MPSISKNLSLDENDWLKLKDLVQKTENRVIESDSEIIQIAMKHVIKSLEDKLKKMEKTQE